MVILYLIFLRVRLHVLMAVGHPLLIIYSLKCHVSFYVPAQKDLTIMFYLHDLYNFESISIYVVKTLGRTLSLTRVETQDT